MQCICSLLSGLSLFFYKDQYECKKKLYPRPIYGNQGQIIEKKTPSVFSRIIIWNCSLSSKSSVNRIEGSYWPILLTEISLTEKSSLNSWERYRDFSEESLSFVLWIKAKQTAVKAVIISLPGREELQPRSRKGTLEMLLKEPLKNSFPKLCN